MGHLELGADMRRHRGNVDAARAVSEGHQVADHGDRRRLAAGAVAGKDHVAAVVAIDNQPCSPFPATRPCGERSDTSMGPTVAAIRPSTCSARETWRMVQPRSRA